MRIVTLCAISGFVSWLVLPLLLFSLSFCEQNRFEADPALGGLPATVFGEAQREEFSIDSEDSWASEELVLVGKLVNPSRYSCTAALVGEDLIVTAGHCVAGGENRNEGFDDLRGFRFRLGFSRGAWIDESFISEIQHGSLWPFQTWEEYGRHWALLRLSSPLGKKWGYFKLMDLDEKASTFPKLMMLGYGFDFNERGRFPTRQSSCSLRKLEKSYFLHDCDESGGDSGAPLYYCGDEDCYLLGVHLGDKVQEEDEQESYSDAFGNIASRVSTFKGALERMSMDQTESKPQK